MHHRCPECGKPHPPQTKHCTCGWCKLEEQEKNSDYQCQFQVRHIRCENMGTICRSVRGNSRKWYCSKHWYDASHFKKVER